MLIDDWAGTYIHYKCRGARHNFHLRTVDACDDVCAGDFSIFFILVDSFFSSFILIFMCGGLGGDG